MEELTDSVSTTEVVDRCPHWRSIFSSVFKVPSGCGCSFFGVARQDFLARGGEEC
jgi:hypothetical protein